MQLEVLNDDCLGHLLKFLAFQDIVRLNVVLNHRLQEVVKRRIPKHEINCLELARSLQPMEYRNFFIVFGNFIKRIRISYEVDYEETFSLLTEYCNNIEYMWIQFGKYQGQLSSIGCLQSLRYLHIKSFPWKRHMDLIAEVVQLQDLEGLHISSNMVFNGCRLHQLAKLKELSLPGCRNLTTKHFIKAFRANRNLTRINIYGCLRVGPKAYRCMAEESRIFESLEFTTDNLLNGAVALPELHHVKKLTVRSYETHDGWMDGSILEDYFSSVGATLTSLVCDLWIGLRLPESLRYPNLIELRVDCPFHEGVNTIVPRLCSICPHLERVIINNHDRYIFSNLALDFFRQMKNLVFADIPISQFFGVRLYKDIVKARKEFNNAKQLKLIVCGDWVSHNPNEIRALMKSNDYAVLRKFVEMELDRKTRDT